MVNFICMGFVELRGTRSKRKLLNEKLLSTDEPTSLRLLIISATSYTTALIDGKC